jgi:ssDNA-specific exonuclease RecJ
MKDFIKRITGLKKLEEEKQALEEARDKAVAETVRAQEAEELAKLTPKERATKKGEAWVSVLDTKVNPDNIRNGFFELDWNELFVLKLKQEGYGFEGDPEEEIVDRWFRDIVRQMLSDEGLDVNRPAGYINVTPISKGKSEVS